jgi:ribosomal protein L37E
MLTKQAESEGRARKRPVNLGQKIAETHIFCTKLGVRSFFEQLARAESCNTASTKFPKRGISGEKNFGGQM